MAEAVVDQVKYSFDFIEDRAQLGAHPNDVYYSHYINFDAPYVDAYFSASINISDPSWNLKLSDGKGYSKKYDFSTVVPGSLAGGSVPVRVELNQTQQNFGCYGWNYNCGEYSCTQFQNGIWDMDRQVCTTYLYLKSLCFVVSQVNGKYILKGTDKFNGNVTKALIEGQMGCYFESENYRYNISTFYPGVYQDIPVTGGIPFELRLEQDPLVVASRETNGSYYYDKIYDNSITYMVGVGLLIGGCLLISVGAVLGFVACGLACCSKRKDHHSGASYGMVMIANSAAVYPATTAMYPASTADYPYGMPQSNQALPPQQSAYVTMPSPPYYNR